MFVIAEVRLAVRELRFGLKPQTSAEKETPQRNRNFPTGRVKGQTVYPENDGLVAYRAEGREKNPTNVECLLKQGVSL